MTTTGPGTSRVRSLSRWIPRWSSRRRPTESEPVTLRIVRLGSDRLPGEGLRIGTVRRPPRGVPKEMFAEANWYDVWYPNLAPSVATLKVGQQAETPQQWKIFVAKYR